MQFDIRTLLVAVAVATAVCAVARFLLWRMHPAMPGLRHWMWASVIGAAALFTYAGHGWIPGGLALTVAQMLIAAGFVVAWDGFRRFLGRPALSPAVLTVMATVAGGSIIASNATGVMAWHTAVNAVVIAVLSGLIVRELWPAGGPGRLAVRATAWIYVANVVFFIARGGAAVVQPRAGVPVTSEGFYALSPLWWLVVTVGATLGMALMAGERLQEELNHRANRDPLTGALNRRAFALLAEKQMAHADRTGRAASVLMMDLDHFKRINDVRGHAAGDAVLRRFVEVAGGILRAEDVLCRFGGEEFVALLPDTAAPQAFAAAERLRLRFAAEGETTSIGIAEARRGEPLEALLRRADEALYEAKRRGRNRCEAAPSPGPPPLRHEREIPAEG